jgi:hypothetical protein
MTRSISVDFSLTIMTTSLTLIAPALSGAAPPQLWVYVDIFSVTVWALVVVMTIMVSVAIMVMDKDCCR